MLRDTGPLKRADVVVEGPPEPVRVAIGEIPLEQVLLNLVKNAADAVKDVRPSTRLEDSPCCVVADESDPSIQMQHILKAMGQEGAAEAKPILEFNPRHPIVKKLEASTDDALVEEASRLLLDQALLLEGAKLADAPGIG